MLQAWIRLGPRFRPVPRVHRRVCRRVDRARIDGSGPSDDRGWGLYAAGRIRGDLKLLEESAECWRKLERPGWLARTLDAMITLGAEDAATRAERDAARVRMAGVQVQVEEQA